jgi:membrane-associated phospholipid phosphatase
MSGRAVALESASGERAASAPLWGLRRQFMALDVIYLGFVGSLLLWALISWSFPGFRLYETSPRFDWARESHAVMVARLAFFFFIYLGLQRFGVRFQRDYYARGLVAPTWLRAMNLVYTFAPAVLAPTVFQGLGSFMAMVSGVPGVETHAAFDPGVNYDRAATWFDAQLKQIDLQVFGVYLPQWMRQFQVPWLTGILFWCYLAYFICPFIAAFPPILRGKWQQVRLAVAMLHATLFMTYVVYILVPATGPRFEGGWSQWLTAEPGWFWAREMATWVDSVEDIRWDAFPSGHVATSITCMIVALMLHRKVGLIYLPFVVGLTVATILLGYHYGTDVLAGFVCVVLTFAFCLPAIKWWEKATNP